MPRSAPRPTQAPAAPGDQAYGAAGEQIAAQEQMPLPDMRAPQPPAGGAPGGSPGPGAPPATDPLAAALAMAPPTAPPWAGDTVLGEPISHGLPSGPGPGPESLAGARPPRIGVADMMRRVAEATGNRYYAELAQDVENFTP